MSVEVIDSKPALTTGTWEEEFDRVFDFKWGEKPSVTSRKVKSFFRKTLQTIIKEIEGESQRYFEASEQTQFIENSPIFAAKSEAFDEALSIIKKYMGEK